MVAVVLKVSSDGTYTAKLREGVSIFLGLRPQWLTDCMQYAVGAEKACVHGRKVQSSLRLRLQSLYASLLPAEPRPGWS